MLRRLEQYLLQRTPEGIALAYSGGVDSTLLLAVLSRLYRRRQFPFAVLTMRTVLQNDAEMADAENLAAQFAAEQKFFTFNPFSLEAVRYNRIDRCYHCKKAIFTRFRDYARSRGLTHLLDGTNADDVKQYRPGRKALKELGVISPLAELEIDKASIRRMSAELGLPTASKPAAPCLATRFEYDTLLDDDIIRRVAAGEDAVRTMFPELKTVRLRVHGSLARLEVPAERLSEVAAQGKAVAEMLKNLGFDYITLDLEGFRSGSFDKGLKQN